MRQANQNNEEDDDASSTYNCCLYTATATPTSFQRIIRLMADVTLCVVERERKRDRNMHPPVDEDG